MRTIKFRGKSIDTNEWLYGDLVRSSDMKRCAILVNDRESYDECEVNPCSIGQFTGFYDCYGKEIYEGDRLFIRRSCKAWTADVEWNNELGGFGLNFGLGLGIDPKPLGEYLKEYNCDVLCHISDIKELIKVDKNEK